MAAEARLDAAAYARHVPDAVRALRALADAAKQHGIEPALIEWADIRASQMNGCAFCLQHHVNALAKLGPLDGARLAQVAAWRESPIFCARERAALGWAEALTAIGPHGVPDAVYAEARAEFGDAGLAALSAAIMAINAWNRIGVAYRFPPPPAQEPAA